MKTASVAEVQESGITIRAEEAVAIAQQLIASVRAGARQQAEPPYGPPSTSTVVVVDDGSVVCRNCDAMPAVFEVAILLQAMLPPETTAPGGLRYTIARALLDVDVPPFDSLDDLSDTLRRYERGPRDAVIARLMERYATRRALAPAGMADRRRTPRATELRRALREADARLYTQQLVAASLARVAADRPRADRHLGAGIACVAAGLFLIVGGEVGDTWSDRRPAPLVPPPVIALPAPAASTADAGSVADRIDDAPVQMEVRNDQPSQRPPRSDRGARARAPRRSAQLAQTRTTRETPRRPSTGGRGVFDKLRLRWLRNMLTSL